MKSVSAEMFSGNFCQTLIPLPEYYMQQPEKEFCSRLLQMHISYPAAGQIWTLTAKAKVTFVILDCPLGMWSYTTRSKVLISNGLKEMLHLPSCRSYTAVTLSSHGDISFIALILLLVFRQKHVCFPKDSYSLSI